MSMMSKLTVLLACAAVALPLAATAQESAAPAVSASGNITIPSAYVWRGQVAVDDPVIQPDFTISKNGFSIGWWGNLNLNDNTTGDEYEFSEHDITVSYSTSCPYIGANFTLGVINFDFPNVGVISAEGNTMLVNDSREAFLNIAFADVLLSPTLSINYDFKQADGFYVNLGVSHTVELVEKVSLALAANLGAADSDWGSYYFGDTDSGLNDWGVSASLPVAVTPNLTLTPAVQYVALLGDAKDVVDATGMYFGDTDKVVGSIKLSYTF